MPLGFRTTHHGAKVTASMRSRRPRFEPKSPLVGATNGLSICYLKALLFIFVCLYMYAIGDRMPRSLLMQTQWVRQLIALLLIQTGS